ncbi:MAG: ATP-binding protein [Usitatibacter sp.]
MAERHPSLRGRLITLLVAGIGLVWAGIGIATYFDARYHSGRIFDAQLAEYSEVLAAVAGHEVYEIAGKTTSLDHDYGQTSTYQVYSRAGDLLLRSHAAPLSPIALSDGFSDEQVAGERWRAYRRVDMENDFVIIVAHRQDERDALVRDFAVRLLAPFALGLPLVALAIWLAVARALVPLVRLARDVGLRGVDRLAPVDATEAPREIVPLVDALNHLFARLERSFDNERRFTGDAAHELRTPLAALRTHAEVALTTASDERRRRSLEQVVAGVERAGRLVEQMLTLARLDSAMRRDETAADLGEIAREVVEAMRPEAAARRVTVVLEAPSQGPRVGGEAAMLHALVRNLVENALRHAPEAGRVRVGLGEEGGRAKLAVEDSGPGVPPEFRERIFERHFRLPGDSGGAAGLGLSIARRVAQLHGGAIGADASPSLGGLRVTVTFPAFGKETLSRGADSGVTHFNKENDS